MKSSSQRHVRLARRVDERPSFNVAYCRVDGKETKGSDTAICWTSATARVSHQDGEMSTSRSCDKMTCMCVFALYDLVLLQLLWKRQGAAETHRQCSQNA